MLPPLLRAAFMYLLLVLISRIAGTRPGRKYTPFEFVLAFYFGGLALTAMIGTEASLTNGFCQVIAIAMLHVFIVWLRHRFKAIEHIFDGTPLLVRDTFRWCDETMLLMRLSRQDVMSVARAGNIRSEDEIHTAVLERSGELSILRAQSGESSDFPPEKSDINVGEDLTFQRKWWRFEHILWALFVLVLAADISGVLGSGPLARVTRNTPDGLLTIQYERVVRSTTPAIIRIRPSAAAIHDGKVYIYLGSSALTRLGLNSIAPQPALSSLGDGGTVYEFPVHSPNSIIEFHLEPVSVGRSPLIVGVAGSQPLQTKVTVLP